MTTTRSGQRLRELRRDGALITEEAAAVAWTIVQTFHEVELGAPGSIYLFPTHAGGVLIERTVGDVIADVEVERDGNCLGHWLNRSTRTHEDAPTLTAESAATFLAIGD